MNCAPLSSGFDHGSSFSRTKIVKARKPKFCCECHEDIAVGMQYEYNCGKWDGYFNSHSTCLSCTEIRNHFGNASGGWIYEMLWEDLQDNFFPDMKAGGPCMEGLSPAAKARLFERRTTWLLRHQ